MFLVNRLGNVNTSDKEIQIDHISLLKEFELVHYQQLHPELFRPYGKNNRTTLLVSFQDNQLF